MRTTFDFYSDPGHGWLKAPITLLVELGIEDAISTYSYMKGDFAYLEEDCDFSLFMRAMRDRGIEPRFREHIANKQSRIRGYDYYRRPKYTT